MFLLTARGVGIWIDDFVESFTTLGRHPSEFPQAYSASTNHHNMERLLWTARNHGANITVTLTGGSSSAAIRGFAFYFARSLATALEGDASRVAAELRQMNGLDTSASLDTKADAGCKWTDSERWLCTVGNTSTQSGGGRRASTGGVAQVVEVVPAANGHTGTDFSAVLMDALVPKQTDILIWEYVINDWVAQQKNPKFLPNALAVYVRRALSINPRMVFFFIHLWTPVAAPCWPFCPGDPRFVWEAATEATKPYYQALDITHIDVNAIGTQYYVAVHGHTKSNESKLMFLDKQHPNEMTHHVIGQMMWQVVRPLLLAAASAGPTPRVEWEKTNHLDLPSNLPGVSNAAHASPAAQLMWRLLATPETVHSWTHSLPHNGHAHKYFSIGVSGSHLWRASATNMNVSGAGLDGTGHTAVQPGEGSPVETAIPAAASRSDSMRYARLPLCDGIGGQLRHTLRLSGHMEMPAFLGINLLAKEGRMLGNTQIAVDLNRSNLIVAISYSCPRDENASASYARRWTLREHDLVPGSLSLSDIVDEAAHAVVLTEKVSKFPDDHGTGFAVLLRGIHAPQLWFRLAPPSDAKCMGARAAPTALNVWACMADRDNTISKGLGAIVFS